MGRSHGTGYPLDFRCSKCREYPCTTLHRVKIGKGESTQLRRCSHTQQRTGRVKPLPPSQRGKGHVRALQERHEYVCDCGHRGWTRHRGVLRLPLEEPQGS